ncbi:SprT family zinc-dependent metalloprotease [Oscillospiraceae bacterium MB08-C2-2]|nr:SprT family zinc-dependent metalloprotease [Oscillospiraceae bacterium MB08-C2-2]
MQYTLKRSKRKSLSLSVTPELEVIVRAPLKASAKSIEAFVAGHTGWVEQTLAKMAQKTAPRHRFACENGDVVYLLGQQLVLEVRPGADVKVEQRRLVVGESGQLGHIEAFFRQKALDFLTERTREWAEKTGKAPTGVKITGAKTRWGSCSSRGSICYSWRLICLPEALIDSVVVHELCHLKLWEAGHSAAFYAEIARYLPDYNQRREQLRQFQWLLTL